MPSAGGVKHLDRVAGIAVGEVNPRQWGLSTRTVDFFDVKGDLSYMFEHIGFKLNDIKYRAATRKGLHPGKAALIFHNNVEIGVLGVLHPIAAKQLQLANREVVVFELNLAEITQLPAKTSFKGWSKYPAVQRDLTFTVANEVPVQDLVDKIHSLQIAELQEITVFAVYTGKGVPEGQKSVSLGLILQDFSSTLADKQLEQIMTNIISLLATSFEAQLRTT